VALQWSIVQNQEVGDYMATSLKAKDADGGETMKSLRLSLRLLLEFSGEQQDFGVGELAERCGVSKGQVSKVLEAFADYGFLAQDPETRRYSVGVHSYTLGSRFLANDRLCKAAMPVMRELVTRTGHSARLSVLNGDEVLYLIGLEGPMFVNTGWRAGTRLPVHSTSAGRVLLAFMEPELARLLLSSGPLRAVTQHTIIDRAKIEKIVASVRMNGYATQRSETTPGLGTMAVPIFDARQQAIGALGIAFPSHVALEAEESEIANKLHRSARTLSQRMGCTVYPFGRNEPMPAQRRPRGKGIQEVL
jgi:DNA-binding IclR family transcriptional regulator